MCCFDDDADAAAIAGDDDADHAGDDHDAAADLI